jgi:putative NIF3 family GTP cyclohydrolase 1 type 2
MPFGKPRVRTVGVVSGGAADELPQAVAAGLDAYVSGEGGLQAYNAARHGGINAFFAGHYATETFGVRALGRHVARRFGLPAEFLDFGLPY